jgi:hypothetical protein
MDQGTGTSAAKTVDEYLAALPEQERAVLQELRETITSAAHLSLFVKNSAMIVKSRVAENEARAQ